MSRLLGLEPEVDLINVFGLLPNLDPSYPRAGRDVHTYRHRDDPSVPYIVFSHLPYDEAIFASTPTVFLVRSPADVLVSYYFHVAHRVRKLRGLGPEEERRRLKRFVVQPDKGAPALAAYWNGWASGLGQDDLVESYERLREDPLAGMRRICRHLGLSLDDDLLRDAITYASFDNMREMEVRGGIADKKSDQADPDALRVRRGVVGGYRDYLDAEDVNAIHEAMSSVLTPASRSLLVRAGLAPQG